MKAMILAAGLGTRLQPLTLSVSKPMVPMAGRPCLEHIILLLKKHGITEIIANLHYLPRQIQSYFGDGSPWGVSLSYSLEEELLGTAGGLKKVQGFFGGDRVLVISGDALTDLDLGDFFRFHREQGALASLALKKVSDPTRYGVVVLEGEGRIAAFQEKPAREEAISDLANTGIYLFEPEIFDYIPPGTFFDFARDVFPRLLGEGRPMGGYRARGYWCDVGSLEVYREAHYDLLMGIVEASIPAKNFNGHLYIGRDTWIHPRTVIQGPVYLGDGCVVQEGARLYGPLSLGPRTRVGRDSFLKRSILWEGAGTGEGACLSDTILGAGVQVSPGEQLEKEVRGSLPGYDFAVSSPPGEIKSRAVL